MFGVHAQVSLTALRPPITVSGLGTTWDEIPMSPASRYLNMSQIRCNRMIFELLGFTVRPDKHTCTRPRGSQIPTIFWGTRRGDAVSHRVQSRGRPKKRPQETQPLENPKIWVNFSIHGPPTPPTQKFNFWPPPAPGPTPNSRAHRGD